LRSIYIPICLAVIMFGITGCQPESAKESPVVGSGPAASHQDSSAKELFVVSFNPAETKKESLRYRLISNRTAIISLGDSGKKSAKSKPQRTTERLELVIVYKPVDIKPYGQTTIEGFCESAKVKRTSSAKSSKTDAVESLAGKSFSFKVSPSGKITDYSQLTDLTRQLGGKAMDSNTRKNQSIKNPDMIFDFIAMQWYLWDSVASIKEPHKGVAIGDSWQNHELIPFPTPAFFTKQTTYTFDSVTDSPEGRIANISSLYANTDARLENMPMPYPEKFQMRGMFGFLRNYRVQSINGTGVDTINIDTGVLQSRTQYYKLEVTATFMLPLGDSSPELAIDQEINIQLLEDKLMPVENSR